MSIELEPMQQLLLWRLAVSEGGGEFLKEIEAKIAAAIRRPLVREGLIEEGTRKPPGGGRAVKYLELTEKGWAWCQQHLDAELKTRSQFSTPILQRLLRLLKAYFSNQEQTVALGEFIRQAQMARPLTAVERDAEGGRQGGLEEVIRQAFLELSSGQENIRVRLADLRSRLDGVPRRELDQKLLEMERDGQLALYPLDNPQEIEVDDHNAALRTATGHERHIVYFGGRGL